VSKTTATVGIRVARVGIIATVLKPVLSFSAGLVTVAALVLWARNDAASDARLACEREVHAATSAEVIRQQRAIADTLLEYEVEAAKAANRIKTLKETADEVINQIQSTGASCPIPPDILERLSGIE
jgi:hypothetical protein